jgi:imidazoleglycerol-phosphate dehydratase
MRKASIERITTETQIKLALTIEGGGRYEISTGIRFLDHMLELFARHGAFDLKLKASGDLDVDQHHTVEDVGIALGEAFHKALGDKRGIVRAGYFLMPMDETLGLAAIDFSGRAAAVVNTQVKTRLVGDLQSELVYDFFEGFARGARANVHLKIVTEDRITTRLKRCSRLLPGHCVWPARAISNWPECCRAPRAFYDRDCRLRRGQHQLVKKSAGASRR